MPHPVIQVKEDGGVAVEVERIIVQIRERGEEVKMTSRIWPKEQNWHLFRLIAPL